MKEITDRLNILKEYYIKLSEDNRNFCNKDNTNLENFEQLISDRATIIGETDLIISELKNIFSELYPDKDFDNKNFIQILYSAISAEPLLAEPLNDITFVLRQLMETDKMVENKVEELRLDLKKSIGKARNNTRFLNGYKQYDTYGSCFINKIK